MSKINCPLHNDNTASMHIYADHAYCFGCNTRVTLEQIDVMPRKQPFKKAYADKPENIAASIERITCLPQKEIRGNLRHYDNLGYYLVYPGNKYYLKRMWGNEEQSKYRYPIGHKTPLYTPMRTNVLYETPVLWVVEGQFNAETLSKEIAADIVSPGSAGNLNKPQFVQYYLQYSIIYVIVDKDAAGVVAGLALKETLLQHKKRVILVPMEKDFNDILVQDGRNAVEKKIKEILEMS